MAHSGGPSACSSASRSGRRPRASCCSRPATGRPACRISARSPRSSAPRWCARPSPACRDLPTELYAFSDDMDGLRKVPDNVPNQAMVAEHLGRPLTAIPDPFGTHESYGAHMNARLQAFLDEFGFAYTFKSGTDEYRSGRFNATLLQGAGAARADPRGGAADAGAGAARDLQPDPADLAQDRPRAAGADRGVPARAGHGRLPRRGRHADRGAGDRRPLQDAVEVRLGAALGGARRRLRDVGQGPDRFGQAVDRRSAACSTACRRRASPTSCSSTSRARRSASPRATG